MAKTNEQIQAEMNGETNDNWGSVEWKNRASSQFEDKKYEYSSTIYPSDLFTNKLEYGANYVVFYINVAEDSKLLDSSSGNPLYETVAIAENERLRAAISGLGLDEISSTLGAAAEGGLVGTILGTLGGNSGKGGGVGALLGGAAGAIVSAAVDGKMSRQQKRLKKVIALYVPNDLNIRYSMNWQDEETGLFQAGAQVSEAALRAATENNKANVSAQAGVTDTARSAITAVALQNAGLSAASGLAPNPKKEQIFKGVDFRTFTFSYQFFPRSSAEARNVLDIIKEFKLHMHPEFKDKASFVYVYPSEFDIYYYHGSQENDAIHKHTSCVLQDMTINYTPNGIFNTFSDGMPTQINVQLTFKELAMLTKEQIMDGF